MFLVLIFTRSWVDPRAKERSEGDMSLKNPVIPPGIDPGTVRLVAQRLNHYSTPDPLIMKIVNLVSLIELYFLSSHLCAQWALGSCSASSNNNKIIFSQCAKNFIINLKSMF